jgi:hypothetical protein
MLKCIKLHDEKGIQDMKIALKGEILFSEWTNARKKEGLPQMPIHCSVGMQGGPMLTGIDYTQNNFDPYTRIYNYELTVDGSRLIESVTIPGARLHFETITTENELDALYKVLADLFLLSYIGKVEKVTMRRYLAKLAEDCGVAYHEIENGVFLCEGRDMIDIAIADDEETVCISKTENEKLTQIVKKIKAKRLQDVMS